MTGYSSRQSPWRIRMMKNKKVLFLDMDGTTLDDEKQLSGENLEALRRAAREGHELVITTGRSMPVPVI